MDKKCKYCEQGDKTCICTKVDAFFADSWYLKYVWYNQAEYKLYYAVPKTNKRERGLS